MSATARRVPNFAGIALVDILANGVAVLIIVIVLSIASRTEQEKQFSEQIQEISTVMTREFSTSLVLNRLAAGPPALLHDYQNSELDQIWDPLVMPVFEIHTNVVRDPYSGRTWSRAELLQEPNSLDDYLKTFDAFQRNAVRGDFYDVGTYYLLMSILSDHSITIGHWHFIGQSGRGTIANPGMCPPGVSAQHCTYEMLASEESSIGNLLDSLRNGGESPGGTDSDTSQGEAWPPESAGGNQPRQDGSSGGNLPQGSQLSSAGESGTLEAGSFPDAREVRDGFGRGSSTRSGGPGSLGEGNQSRLTIRLSDPNAEPMAMDGMSMGSLLQDPAQLLAGLMLYLSEIQDHLDKEQPPTQLLRQFIRRLDSAMRGGVELNEAQKAIVDDLTLAISIRAQHIDGPDQPEPLILLPLPSSAHPEAVVRVPMNRVISEAEIQTNNNQLLESLPKNAKVRFLMQAYPDFWTGLQVKLERNAILMVAPEQSSLTLPKWRVVAYISPQLDDFVVGFIYSQIQDDSLIEIIGDSNMSLVGTQSVSPVWETNPLSIQVWRTGLYLALGLLLIALLLFWRPSLKVN